MKDYLDARLVLNYLKTEYRTLLKVGEINTFDVNISVKYDRSAVITIKSADR